VEAKVKEENVIDELSQQWLDGEIGSDDYFDAERESARQQFMDARDDVWIAEPGAA
jgi:hypothetical protein